MLHASQKACLEAIVHEVHPDLQIEEASLNAQQTLQLVLCNDFMCLQPLHITMDDVDIPAALAGQPTARKALQQHLQVILQGRR